MKLEYDNGTLRVENASGLRWQLADVEKPRFAFEYDALQVSGEHALRRLGAAVLPLAEAEAGQVRAYVEHLQPPPWATFQNQLTMELRAFAQGLINSLLARLEYGGLVDAMVTGREGSTDLHAKEARRVLAYVDLVWNTFHGLAAQIRLTPTGALKSLREYANMIPAPPEPEHFSGCLPRGLFDGPPAEH